MVAALLVLGCTTTSPSTSSQSRSGGGTESSGPAESGSDSKQEPTANDAQGGGAGSNRAQTTDDPEITVIDRSTRPELQQLQEVTLPDATFPLKLSELSDPSGRAAHMRLHFSVLDSDGRAISDLRASDFSVRENDIGLNEQESALRILRAQEAISVPVVLLLDMSRSVIRAGSLNRLKQAANIVVSAILPEQELAILVFADSTRTLSNFSSNKESHRSAIESLVQQEGNSTNLFGAMIQAYGLWQDGVARPLVGDAGVAPPADAFNAPASAASPALVVGMLIAISDGNDTASVASLTEVIDARENKNTLFLRAGEDLDLVVANQLATLGVLDITDSNAELQQELTATLLRASQLNEALYVAEYCSPKRAGEHQLSLSVLRNTEFLQTNPPSECQSDASNLSSRSSEQICLAAGTSCTDSGGENICCPPEFPFACVARGLCRETAAQAAMLCGASCIDCNRAITDFVESDGLVEIQFSADTFSSAQCNALFEAVDSAPPEEPRPEPTSNVDAGESTVAPDASLTSGGLDAGTSP